MNSNRFLLAFLTFVALAGCNRTADLGPQRDVPYYTAHPAERAAMIAKCDADSGNLNAHSNCINARDSQWKQSLNVHNNKIPDLPDDARELDSWRK